MLFSDLQSVGPPARRDHFCTSQPCDLHPVDPQTSDAENDYLLSNAYPAPADQAMVHARNRIGLDGTRIVSDAWWQTDHIRRGHGNVLGMAPVALKTYPLH